MHVSASVGWIKRIAAVVGDGPHFRLRTAGPRTACQAKTAVSLCPQAQPSLHQSAEDRWYRSRLPSRRSQKAPPADCPEGPVNGGSRQRCGEVCVPRVGEPAPLD